VTKVVAIVPCFNEEKSIGKTINSLKNSKYSLEILVVDNGSFDFTQKIAVESGAKVVVETRKGKGFAVRRGFAEIDFDCCVVIDGDGTYDTQNLDEMISLVIDQKFDMVVGKRTSKGRDKTYPVGHVFGNKLITLINRILFGYDLTDSLSGLRVMSRSFVKSFVFNPANFEIEVTLNVHSMLLNAKIVEVECDYFERPNGSISKLNTFRDGFKITYTLIKYFSQWKPGQFIAFLSTFLFLGVSIITFFVGQISFNSFFLYLILYIFFLLFGSTVKRLSEIKKNQLIILKKTIELSS
jgi:glycosyltransferase involved in cell wall biosynthesis